VTTTETFDPSKVDEFAGRLMPILAGGILSQLVDLGDRTGLFEATAIEPGTSEQIAARAGLQERYVREWLGAMSVAGIVDFDPASDRFHLVPEHAVLLVGSGSLAPVATANTVLARHVPRLARVFREGGGIPYAEYSPDFSDAMDRMSRGGFDQFLVSDYLPLAEGLVERLTAGARVADLCCGAGHALVVLATAFPRSTFVGYDLDEHAVELGRREAAERGLANLSFEIGDATSVESVEPYDAIVVFDALHDQVDPPALLARIHSLLRDDGVLLLCEPHAADSLEGNLANPMAAVQYAVSTMHCLTVSLAHGGAGIGTAFGEQLARDLLQQAGFEDPAMHPAPGQPFNVVYVTHPRH
jgi:SAM-dependent methyltransferase